MKKLIAIFILIAFAAPFAQTYGIGLPYTPPASLTPTPGIGGPCTSSSQCGFGTAWTCSGGTNGHCFYHACNCGNRCGNGVCVQYVCLACSTSCACPESSTTCPEDCPPPCTSQCSSVGQTQCTGNVAQTCVQSGNCLVWSNTTCGAGQTCSGGSCVASCTSYCSYYGQTQCYGTQIMTCGNYDADPCLEWSSPSNCASGYTCSAGSCSATCTNECTSGSKGCTTSAQQWYCYYGSDGCYHKGYQYCSPNYNCQPSTGNCVLGCTSDCTAGSTGCSSAFQRWACTQGADGCYHYNYASCGTGQGCAGGSCSNLPTCSLFFSPSSVVAPGSATLNLNSAYGASAHYSCWGIYQACANPYSAGCTAPLNGIIINNTYNTSALLGTQYCNATVANAYGSATCSASLSVAAGTPTCSLFWSNPAMTAPGSANLTIRSGNATVVTGSCSGAASLAPGSTITPDIPVTLNFNFLPTQTGIAACTFYAGGPGGSSAPCYANMTVTPASVCPAAPCSSGQTNCVGGALQSCEQNASGCWVWGPLVSCPTSNCVGGSCLPPPCPAPACSSGQTQCSGSQQQGFTQNASGCWVWGTPTNCPSGQACAGGSCAGSAQNQVNVYLQSPATSYSSTSASIAFNFLATNTLSSTLDCKLMIDGVPWARKTDTVNNTATSFTLTNLSTSSSHYWEVTCTAVKCT